MRYAVHVEEETGIAFVTVRGEADNAVAWLQEDF
jgi:hypothetical protein